jgi:hypothetical protein
VETVLVLLVRLLGTHAPGAVTRYLEANRDVAARRDQAISHLYGIQNAPTEDIYANEKYLLGEELAKLQTASGGRRRFKKDVRAAQRIHGTIVIGGKRDVQGEIAELVQLAGR